MKAEIKYKPLAAKRQVANFQVSEFNMNSMLVNSTTRKNSAKHKNVRNVIMNTKSFIPAHAFIDALKGERHPLRVCFFWRGPSH